MPYKSKGKKEVKAKIPPPDPILFAFHFQTHTFFGAELLSYDLVEITLIYADTK